MARIEVTGESLRAAVDKLRAELDDVIGKLAAEAGDCDPDDGWYPDTSDLDDLLDQVEDLADGAPDAARELAGHVAGRIRDVLAAGNCLTDDLADALAAPRSYVRSRPSYVAPYLAGRSSVVRSPKLARACRACCRAMPRFARTRGSDTASSSGLSSW